SHLALEVADARLDRAELGAHALDLADLVLDRLLALPGPGDHLVLAVEEPERSRAHGPEQDRLADELEHRMSLRFGREGTVEGNRHCARGPGARARRRATRQASHTPQIHGTTSGEVTRTSRALPNWPFHACPAPGRTRLASARSAGEARDAEARVPSARISSSPQ